MNRLAIFDCDGTLVDSQATICRAMAAGFAACGLDGPGDAATRSIIGLSLPEAMAVLHPRDPAAHTPLGVAYKQAFFNLRAAGHANEPLYSGIVDTLDTLEAHGWLLGVATGKSDRGLKHILEHHGLFSRFATLQTADRHPSKPHPSMIDLAMTEAGASSGTTAMIGDTSYDMAMAKAAGCRAIGVTWGYHSPEMLREAGADAIATHPLELAEMIESAR